MGKLGTTILTVVLVFLCKQSLEVRGDNSAPLIVQPEHTLAGSDTESATPGAIQDPSAAKNLAKEISSKALPPHRQEDLALELRHEILQNNDTTDKTVQLVRESHLLNAFHEAIDEKIVNHTFIHTLRRVGEPPEISDYTRDSLIVNSIREDVNFTFGEGVFQWKTLKHKTNDQHMIFGLSNESIVVLYEQFGEYELKQTIPMETLPTAFEVTTVWDTTEESAVGCLIVATELSLVWYTIRDSTGFVAKEEWRWPLLKITTLIKVFTFKDIHMILLIGTHPNKQKSISATLYEFQFEQHQFWLMQKLQLNFPCKTVGVVNTGSEFLIAFPQNDTAHVYTLEAGKRYRGKFTPIANFTSEQLNSVGAFQIGRYAYIAIGGKNPQIVRYANEHFETQSLPTQAFEIVEAFFEIPTSSYRDDLILLVQHRTTFSTHDLQRLELFAWNGESFDIRSNIPCYVEDELHDYEVSCLLDLYRSSGIHGSTVVQVGKQVSMIVPRYKAHSSLFHLHIEMLSAEHPITQKINEIHETIEAFTRIIEYQDIVIRQALALIGEPSLMNQERILLENCTMGHIEANVVYQHSALRWPDDRIIVGNVTWTYADTAIDVPTMVLDMENDKAELAQLEHQLQYTVRRHNDSFSLNLEQPLHVHGQVEVGGSLVTDDLYVRRLVEEPFTIREPRDTEEPLREMHVKNLKVQHLNFETVNGIPASELVFNTGDTIVLEDKIVFEGSLEAYNIILPKGGMVNGVDLSESTVYFNCKNRRWKKLHFDSVEVLGDVSVAESINGMKLDLEEIDAKMRAASPEENVDVLVADKLVLDGSLYFQTINGIPWGDIINHIVLKNRPNRLAELKIEGNLILNHPNITVYHLNGLEFPDDFLLSNSPREAIVTGHKRFMNTTYINTLTVEGTVNGTDLRELITLHDDQHIAGNITIGQLQVSEGLEVKGTIRGSYMDEFLSSPTLLSASHIKTACQFDQLHVDGPIIVKHTMNGNDLDAILADVVYDTERNVEIVGTKRIASAEFRGGLTLTSNMINGHSLDEFVTRSTDQVLNISEISGDIFIQHLTIDGLFDGLNVTEMDLNSIKIFGDQYTGATLIFQNPSDSPYPDIEANELRIQKALNSKSRSEYMDIEQDELVFTGEIDITDLEVEHLKLVNSAIDGPSKTIGNVHLPTFDELRFSLTRPQDITAPFYIEQLIVAKQIEAAYVNGQDLSGLREELDRVNNIKSHLLMGNIPIENLYVKGDIQVNMLNDVNFDELLHNVIWLDRTNRIPGTMRFLDPLYIEGNFTVNGFVNDVNFDEFVQDLALKSTGVTEFTATKVFTNGFIVGGDMETQSINNIDVQDMALKNQTIVLHGDLEIIGQLSVENLQIDGLLNGEPVQDLVDLYQYDESRDMHVINGDMYFDKVSINSLNINGSLNHIPNVDVYLRSLIRKDQDYIFTEPITFLDDVIIEKDFTINTLAGIDISNIANEIVRINSEMPVELMGEVVFMDSVYVKDMAIYGDLITPNIDGFNPDTWIRNGIMVNKDVEIYVKTIFQPGTLGADHINVQYLNGQPTDMLITLNTDQNIQTELYIDELTITQPLEVGGLINGVHFPYERQNTFMTYGTQWIRMPTVFNSIRVLKSLTLPPVINGRPFGKPVVLGPKMVIESPVTFQNLRAKSLQTDDMISGVDFNQWYENSLWRTGRDHQVIDANVSATNVHFRANVEGNGVINGVEFNKIVQKMRSVRQNVDERLNDVRSEFRTLCSSTKDLVDKSQNRTYFFKYFVQRQVINEHQDIQSFHFFDHLGYHFLALNTECDSHFFQWDPVGKAFVPLFKSNTGRVEEWDTVIDDNRAVYLVTRSINKSTECEIHGVSVWLFTGVQLQQMWNAAEVNAADAVKADPLKSTSFYLLKEDKVMEYSVDGSVFEHWTLPKSILGYRFIPSEVGLGLSLSDGKTLVLLSNTNQTRDIIRSKRSNNETTGIALFSTQSMYDRMSRNYTLQTVGPEHSYEAADESDLFEPGTLISTQYRSDTNESEIHTHDSPPRNVPYTSLHANDTMEATIARDIPLGGILIAENQHFPEKFGGEIIAFKAGPRNKKRHLVAVSVTVDAMVKGDHDAIKIYFDIQTGKLYQVLPCHRPSHLAALELKDETIIAFLESLRAVQIYIYRGMQGFVKISSFKLASPAIQMTGLSLPQSSLLKCKFHYLAIATEQQELVLLKARTQGDCGLVVEMNCDAE
ncbi:uncharacterized protein LOC129780074 isoform X2 [Toxorhynchites rutilus septentrionalis]|uniref:uncharacterized protein LOC129780074 isoform X2 n=1 Tax=Toxorhynchites rutilus septentrionalis TaxID=329112 RepID=UPI002479AD10|nr:uncharacterized protein LOC129780074 isoform X2 [Toxorhynchites rutilus septentrionalis]